MTTETPAADIVGLKVCPFCGGDPISARVDRHGWQAGRYRVFCRGCLIRTEDMDARDQAITAWNNRVDADEITRLRAENAELQGVVEWYGEQARLCRLIHSGGDSGRHALQDDGGKRARAALTSTRGEA